MKPPVVECAHLWKQYGGRPRGIKDMLVGRRSPAADTRYSRKWALQDVSFQVEKGTAFGVVGHNGSGKSTLLSLLLGVSKPNRGDLRVNGRIASLLELGAGFHPELTGRENIFLYGSILGMTRAEIRERFEDIVTFSELENAVESPIRTYSSGMITRLGFSTIIHVPCDLLLIDEVLAVGDGRFQGKCLEFLKDFKMRNGTLVIVSHDLATLETLCDRGMCLDMGQVKIIDEIDRVASHHRSLIASPGAA